MVHITVRDGWPYEALDPADHRAFLARIEREESLQMAGRFSMPDGTMVIVTDMDGPDDNKQVVSVVRLYRPGHAP